VNILPPTSEEYNSHFADYIQRATAKGDVFNALKQQIEDIKTVLGVLSDEQALYRNGPQEWSIKEVTGHMIDVERVFSYRLLRISRKDATPLAGYEDQEYVKEAVFDRFPLMDLIGEFEFLRRANILAVKNIPSEYMLRRGTASGATVSVRALIYILVGHVEHHMASLHEKYLPGIK
jgi:hypothetical protein